MKNTYHIFNSGTLRRKSNTLFLEGKNGKCYLPAEMTGSIFVHSSITLNTSVLEFLSEKEISLAFFSPSGKILGHFIPFSHRHDGKILLLQVEHYTDETKRTILARKFVLGSMRNMRHNISYYNQRNLNLEEELEMLDELKKKAENSNSVSELMAYEGNYRELYFRTFNKILRSPDFRFYRRTTRPPQDPINSMISFVYSLLYGEIQNQGVQTKLNLAVAYLHSTNKRSNSLIYDISEIFKPVIADRLIFSMINRREITVHDFHEQDGGIYITKKGKIKICKTFEKAVRRTYRGTNGATWTFRSWIREEFYKIIRHLKDGKEYEPFALR